jgi:hypothetical protein
MQVLQKLSRSEETALIDLVRANGLDVSKLACHMTRQQGSGRGTVPGGKLVRSFNIHYDLMLCKFCGSAFENKACPKKVNDLKERIKQLNA